MAGAQGWNSIGLQIGLVVVSVPLFAAILVWTWDMPDPQRALVLVPFVLLVAAVSYLIDERAQRRLDEMEMAARGFAARWSGVAVLLLLVLSAFLARPLLNELYAGIPRHAHADAPQQMFILGILAALAARGLGTLLLRSAWHYARR